MSRAADTSDEPIEIDVEDPANRWRFTCPNEHTQFQPTNGGLWCKSCERNFKYPEAHHETLIDKKTGERLDWDAVVLVDANGERV